MAIPGEDPIILIFAPPVTYSADGNQTRASAVNQPDVWLRSISSNAGSTTWAFSPDGKAFTAAGEKYKFEWASYRGDRIGIFSYSDQADAGFVDVDEFKYILNGRHTVD